ncbi:MAG: DUF4112 domain-containing protein [Sphingomonadales bacterium]
MSKQRREEDHTPDIARVAQLAHLLDSQFRLPVLGFSFGLDGLIGLIPVVGDLFGAGVGMYLFWVALRLGARKRILLQILCNVLFDAVIGLIPVVGDIADFANKANAKNAALLLAEYRAGRLKNVRHADT